MDNMTSQPTGRTTVTSERLLRLDDIAERLAVSRSMAWKLVACGDLRSVRIGRAVRVRPTDLEAYIASATREV